MYRHGGGTALASGEDGAARLAIVVHPQFRHTLPSGKPLPPPRHWEKLPNEVLHTIVSHLSTAQDVCRVERVSKAGRRAANDERLWRALCKAKFMVPADANPSSWKELYRFNHVLLRCCLRGDGGGRRRLEGPSPMFSFGARIRVTA